MKTVTVKHPVFKDVEMNVTEKELPDYLEQGWLRKSQRRKATVSNDAAAENTSPATDEEN